MRDVHASALGWTLSSVRRRDELRDTNRRPSLTSSATRVKLYRFGARSLYRIQPGTDAVCKTKVSIA